MPGQFDFLPRAGGGCDLLAQVGDSLQQSLQLIVRLSVVARYRLELLYLLLNAFKLVLGFAS
jgi:hypothetical protein